MKNIFRELILKKCPDYDFERYRFNSGDYTETLDGARIVVQNSALEYVNAYVISRSLKYRQLGEQEVYYTDLPYYKKEAFCNKLPKIKTGLNWKLYDFVHVENGDMTLLLVKEVGHQKFHAYVLSCENQYYLHTGIYIENPYSHYIA